MGTSFTPYLPQLGTCFALLGTKNRPKRCANIVTVPEIVPIKPKQITFSLRKFKFRKVLII